MPDKVVPLPKRPKPRRVGYKGLPKAFRRFKTERQLQPVKPEELKLLPSLGNPPMEWYTARYDGPGETYREVALHVLSDLGIGPELLLYRVLRDLFGQPDNVTVAFPAGYVETRRELNSGEGPLMWEWAYLLTGSSSAIYEIRKQPGTQRPHLALWLPRLVAVGKIEKVSVSSEFKYFIQELGKTLQESQFLVNKRELKENSISIGPLNLYGDMLASGDEQLAAATQLMTRNKSTDRRRHPQITISPSTFYMAAAIKYLLAFEAYVNILSELLRKSEYSDALFNRLIVDVDFESRLLSLAIFCRGFERNPFAPEMPVSKSIRELRSFRNKILHGSFSHDDHIIRTVTEDHYMFHWWPALDERELAKSENSSLGLPLARSLFTKNHAVKVRQTVEAAIDAVVDAMQSEYKVWAIRWRRDHVIPAILGSEGWHPNLPK